MSRFRQSGKTEATSAAEAHLPDSGREDFSLNVSMASETVDPQTTLTSKQVALGEELFEDLFDFIGRMLHGK